MRVLLAGSACLLLALALAVSYQRTDHEKEIMDALFFECVVEGERIAFQPWEDEEEGRYYLFLPSCFRGISREFTIRCGRASLRINGIFSFNIAFQCKRYQGVVSSGDIRDFRGSLTTNIEKGVFITTGSFSKAAVEEASSPGKQQIDLIDGEEFITKLAEFGIGVKEVKDYEIDEDYFAKL